MAVKKVGKSYAYDFYFEGQRYRQGRFKTKAEALHAERILYNQLMNGIRLQKDLTFAEYFEKWMETNKLENVSDRTYKTYKSALKHIKKSDFGKIKLKDLSRDKFQDFINEYAKEHAKDTIKKFKGACGACFEAAVFDGLMIKNINHNITYTAGKESQKEETKFIEMKDYERVKKQLMKSDSESSLFLFVMLITGARFSGAAALRREYIDEVNSTIYIAETKTDLSPRTLTVPRKDLSHILRGIERLPVYLDGKVFHLSYTAVNKQIKRVCKQLEIEEVTSHALRHTHCSYLYAKGLSIEYISKRLGHANTSTTREIYQHMFKETFVDEDAKAMEILEAM
ncbi:tyrosine-type recombinase/integrase [Macrococcus bovicus]|uniref:Site-specific integrase n=1 Tax=Macrococcus bovicus TaxID=69968 RepID=A0A4R6C2X2_9STAP|nr:site-specific integrase [Macrococcus bovicus]TDM15727.1 site-specific integrase [Macrococcus bovicus]